MAVFYYANPLFLKGNVLIYVHFFGNTRAENEALVYIIVIVIKLLRNVNI